MKIVVLVKEVPDTWGERKLDLETGLADRAASDESRSRPSAANRIRDSAGLAINTTATTLTSARPDRGGITANSQVNAAAMKVHPHRTSGRSEKPAT